MKKTLLLLTLMILSIFSLSSCDTLDIPFNNSDKQVDNVDDQTSNIKKTYTVTYYDEDNLYLSEDILEGESFTEPTLPTKDGFTFKYWTKDSIPYTFGTIISSNIDLYAHFEAINVDAKDVDPINNIVVTEDGLYNQKDEVALYIATYHKLPSNYMTKAEADNRISSIWTEDNKASIGGDTFYNREGLLPISLGITYTELDIDYSGSRRNAKRIVYSNDFRIFYTGNHYGSFLEYDKETREWKSY
ncbi:ribonuclease domain-containing protein [Candidatus Izimaplasma bacterium ZiA1]|uniref:ribonuclease domain-containing protein n=1 Tax=Candidatus Izimoplasma sp. ZiA1 TaxID=2024899 RepID=UPI001439673C